MSDPSGSSLRYGSSLRSALDALCLGFGIAELYLFGSRAAEIAKRLDDAPTQPDPALSGSDVDVGIRTLPGRHLRADEIVDISTTLADLFDVPRVDLVLVAAAPPFLALEIIRGELVYCADHHAQSEFELYVLRRAGDLAPFQRMRHELGLSRYEDR